MVETIINNFEIWATAQSPKTKGRGISADNQKLVGISCLRNLILELAVRGKLVPQNQKDESASELLERDAKEKTCVTENGNDRQYKQVQEIEEYKKPFEIPKNWEWRHLDECFLIMSGSSFDKAKELDSGQYLYVKVADMNLKGNEFEITTSSRFYNPTKKEQNALIPAGSIIFPKRGGAIATNKKRLIKNDLFVDLNIMAITPIKSISLDYSYYWLMGIDLAKLNTGTSVPQINHKDIAPLLFPIPPKAEQYRIVAKVDELMALCDQLEQQQTDSNTAHEMLVETLLDTLTNTAGQAELESAWERIANHFDTLFTTEHSVDRLKQTILQLAVMGKLVPQNPEDEPAGELLKKIGREKARLVKEGKIKKQNPLAVINDNEKVYELPIGWFWSRIGNASLSTEYGLSEMTFNGIKGIPVLKMGDIQDGKVMLGGQKLVPENVEGLPFLYLNRGDLLYNRTNSAELVGKTGIFNGNDDAYTFASYLIRIRCSDNFINAKYLNLAMNAPLFRVTQIEPHVKQQCGQANVNGTILKNMIVPIPPIDEQHRIVAKVDELFGICDALKDRIREVQGIEMDLAGAVVEGALK